jgi:hypothetical protein
MLDYNPSMCNACPYPPGITPHEKGSLSRNQDSMKHVNDFINGRIFVSRKAASALIFFTLLTTILTFPYIRHNVIVPYLTPRFDGVIVYVDGYSGSWCGSISLSNEAHKTVQTISGNYAEEYLLRRPINSLDWNVTVTVNLYDWINEPVALRIVNGSSCAVLSEGVIKFDGNIDTMVVTTSVKLPPNYHTQLQKG